MFKKIVGPSYEKWDNNGIRFISMDVSMLVEQYAHFDGAQMKKLEADLSSLPEGAPAIISFHHPPFHSSRFFDNDLEFAELIRKYNVPLVLDGHGHSYVRYAYNGTSYAMGGSTFGANAGYRVWKVSPDAINGEIHRFGKSEVESEDPIPMTRATDSAPGDLKQASAGVFELKPASGYEFKSASYKIDDLVTGTATSLETGRFEVDVKKLPVGRHEIVVTAETGDGLKHLRACLFDTSAVTADSSSLFDPISTITREWALGSGGQANPTVNGDVMYVGANDGLFRAIDLKTGDIKWNADLTRETLSTPVVVDGRVYTAALDGNVYCFDAETGKEIWKTGTDNAILASPLVADGRVYIGSGDFHMYAMSADTGDILWKFAAQKHIKMTPALENGKLYFGAWDNWFYCVDAKSGELVWKVPASRSVGLSSATCNPAVKDGRVLMVTHDYSVRCLDARNGSHLWMYKPAKDELGPSYSSAVLVGDMAYLGSINGHVVGYNMVTGEKSFDVDVRPEKTDALFDSAPLIRGDKLYIGSVGGNVYCIDIPSQKVAWSVALQPGFIFTGPAAWGDKLLISSMGNRIFEIPIEPVSPR
jgi:outer membrane protein assembly factor BamB